MQPPFRIETPNDIFVNTIIDLTNSISYLTDETANVKSYGAVGDGYTDDTNAIIEASLFSSSILFFPKGRYLITSDITFNKDNLIVYGEDAVLTGTGSIIIANTEDDPISTSVISPITSSSTSIFFSSNHMQPNDWAIINNDEDWYWTIDGWVKKRNLVQLTDSDGNLNMFPQVDMDGSNITAEIFHPLQNVYVSGILFESIQLRFHNVCNATVKNCTFRSTGIIGQHIFSMSISDCSWYGEEDIIGIDVADAFGVRVSHCCCNNLHHLFKASSCVESRINDCISISNYDYMIYLGTQSINSIVSSNRCNSTLGGAIYNSGTAISIIDGNYFICSSTALDDLDYGLVSPPPDVENSYAYSSVIVNNFFQSTNEIKLSNYYLSLNVTDNVFYSPMCIYSLGVGSINVSSNHVMTSGVYGIEFKSNDMIYLRENVNINNNTIKNYTQTAIRFSASPIPSKRTNTLNITNNIMDASEAPTSECGIWLGSGYFGSNIIIKGNMILNADTVNQRVSGIVPIRFSKAPIIEYVYTGVNKSSNVNTTVGYETSPNLSNGTSIDALSIIWNSQASQGESVGWVCTASGTFGTLSGVTADSDGSNVIVLNGNDDGDVYEGCWITIGVINVQVLNISDDFTFATVSTTIPIAVGTSVSYTNPTMVEFGRISDQQGPYVQYTGATDQRTISASIGSLTLSNVASKLDNLIEDLVSAGILRL